MSNKLADLMQRCWANKQEDRPSFKDIVAEEGKIFDDIVLEAITKGNEECFNLWNSFGQDDNGKPLQSVAWGKFLKKFLIFLGVQANEMELRDSLEIKCIIESLDVQKNNDRVTLANFERFLDLFPPINKGVNYLHQIKELLKEEWFFGEMDVDESNNLLSPCKKDCFLVRFSATYKNTYVISVKKGKNITHNRVPNIDIHSQVKSLMKKNHVKPITGVVRKFAHIFVTKKIESGGYVSFHLEQSNKKDNKQQVVEEPEEVDDNNEVTLDLTRTFSSLPQKNVVFVN